MKDNQAGLKMPIAFIIFNRSDLTKKVFAEIRKIKPESLYIIADGPRNEAEKVKCQEARAVVEDIDWQCEVHKNYSDTNLGCKKRVSSGLDWFFENVESGIILEDDCLPSQDFFCYCENLLEFYKQDERVMMISGTNLLKEWKSNRQSYHFSVYGGIWGWASWKRAWKFYDVDMKLWNSDESKNKIKAILTYKQYKNREILFNKTFAGEIDTWDYQWHFARLLQSGLTAVPSVNLVSNIGFRHDATHTKSLAETANLPRIKLDFPLKPSEKISADFKYDNLFFKTFLKGKILPLIIIDKARGAVFAKVKKLKKILKEMVKDLLFIARSLNYEYFHRCYPDTLQLLITKKCNSHCVMCNIWKNQSVPDLEADEIAAILGDKLFNKISGIGINGGEPTLREDFSSVIDIIFGSLKKLKSATLLTNCINEKDVIKKIRYAYDKSIARGIEFTVALSFDGLGDIHDLNRGTKDNFVSLQKVIGCLQQEDIPFFAGMTLTPINCYYAEDVLKFCLNNNIQINFRLGVEIKRLFNNKYEEQNKLSAEQLFHITGFFHKLSISKEPRSLFYKSLYEQLAYGNKRSAGCAWKKSGVTLDANGDISYCSVRSPILGNALKKSAFSVYNDNLKIRREIIGKFCPDCKHDLNGLLSPKNAIKYVGEKWAQHCKTRKKIFKRAPCRKTKGIKIYSPAETSAVNWKKVLITGWYGTETAGDKAILGELLHFLRRTNPNIIVNITSYNKYVTEKTFKELNERYENIIDINSIPDKFIKESDAIIIGGGPLMAIEEMEHIRDVFLRANNAHTDRVIFGCGINVNLPKEYEVFLADILKLATKSFFRDRESLLLAEKYGIGGIRGFACDPSIAYVDRIVQNNPSKERKDISILVRENTFEYSEELQLNDKNEEFCAMISAAAKKLIDEGYQISLLPMHNFFIGGDDRIFNSCIREKINRSGCYLERSPLALNDLICKINDSECVVSMRYHGHLFPFAMEIPFFSVDYTGPGGKVNNFLNDINYPYSMVWDKFNVAVFLDKFKKMIASKKELSKQLANEKKKKLHELENIYRYVFKIN